MAADLHIHVLEGASEADVMIMNRNTFGSKYFNVQTIPRAQELPIDKIFNTPNIWIGEVSWLKARIRHQPDELDTFVPSTIQVIQEAIGEELPVLDEALKQKILEAFSLGNKTGYRLADRAAVEQFLSEHMGKPLFTISW